MSALPAHLLAWPGLCVLGIANGVLRERSYGRRLPELRAHQLSTLLLAIVTAAAAALLAAFAPLATPGEAWAVGVAWLAMTVSFEFAFGRFVAGHSWSRLCADYDLGRGRVWGLYLVLLACLPPLARAVIGA